MSADESRAEIVRLADDYVAEFTARFPDVAELSALPLKRHDGFRDNSLAALAAWEKLEDRWAERLSAIDPRSVFGQPEWVTLGFLREAVEASRQERVCRSELWRGVSHMAGWQVEFVALAQAQPVGSKPARDEALSRFSKLPHFLDNEIDNLREGVKLGFTSPQRNVDLVVKQLDGSLALPVEKWPMYSIATRDGTDAFGAQLSELLSKQITPAVKKYRDFLRDEYRAKARENQAVSALPDGMRCYRALLRGATSLDRSPEEVMKLGTRALERNVFAALTIGRDRLGTGELAPLVAKLRRDPANHFRSREEMMAFARSAVDRARTAAPRFFAQLPKTEVRVEAYPDELGPEVSDSYWPATGAQKEGTYRIGLLRYADRTRSEEETTTFHETYPGHHVQVGLALELPNAHLISRIASTGSFVEGWARYAEALADELGLYSSDYARVQRRLWPARGMVLDPGFHVQGWSRAKVVEFVVESGRFSEKESEDVVDRIAVMPGQLTSYDSGGLEFFELRQDAERELGSRFDLRAFHAVVLGQGAVTLPMLRELVHEWIERQRPKG
jgi:uncharacterized protein (DUF885 family)